MTPLLQDSRQAPNIEMLDVSNPTKVGTLEQIVVKTKAKKLQENGSHPLVPNVGHGMVPKEVEWKQARSCQNKIELDCVILELGKKPNAQPLQGQSNSANCHYI